MKRTIGTLTAALMLCAAGLALAAGGAAHIKLHKSGLGKLVTNGSSFTVYMFTKDSRDKDRCMKIKFCTGTWPPVTTHGKPIAGPGVKQSLLGKITIGHGKSQVTYAGHPLYTYSADTGPAQTAYVGIPMFGGKWYGLTTTGNAVK